MNLALFCSSQFKLKAQCCLKYCLLWAILVVGIHALADGIAPSQLWEIEKEVPCSSQLDPIEKARALLDLFSKRPGRTDFLPVLDFTEITDFKESYWGVPIRTARYRGRAIFLKPLWPSNNRTRISEAAWVYALRVVGLGPGIVGLFEIDGVTYLATEYLEGSANTKFPKMVPGILVSRKIREEMERQVSLLLKIGIEPQDLQFVLNRKGTVVLIDPEHFSYAPSKSKNISSLDEVNLIISRWLEEGGEVTEDIFASPMAGR